LIELSAGIEGVPGQHGGAGRDFYFRLETGEEPGLPDGVTRWDVLRDVRRARKTLKLTSGALQYLEWLIQHTFDQDWTAGNVPIAFIAVSTSALHFGVTPRQIHNYERHLCEAGLLTWKDSGNRRRYGKRDADGSLQFAYGADLSPMIERFPAISRMAEAEALADELARQTRASVKSYRRCLRDGIKRAADCGVDAPEVDAARAVLSTVPGRLPLSMELPELISRSLELEAACLALKAPVR